MKALITIFSLLIALSANAKLDCNSISSLKRAYGYGKEDYTAKMEPGWSKYTCKDLNGYIKEFDIKEIPEDSYHYSNFQKCYRKGEVEIFTQKAKTMNKECSEAAQSIGIYRAKKAIEKACPIQPAEEEEMELQDIIASQVCRNRFDSLSSRYCNYTFTGPSDEEWLNVYTGKYISAGKYSTGDKVNIISQNELKVLKDKICDINNF